VATQRETELERKLAEAETKIAVLEAASVPSIEKSAGRKTMPTAMSSMLAKQGVAVESLEAGALDAALTGLSVEQRIAVKAELMRAGMLG
jgi:hypothetical protein